MPGYLTTPSASASGIANVPSGNISASTLQGAINELDTEKADDSSVTTALSTKADQSSVDSSLALKADQSSVDSALSLKADQSSVDSALALKAPLSSPSFSGGVSIDNTDSTNILNVGDDLNLIKYHWRYGYNYPDSPAILRIDATSGGNANATWLISTKSRDNSNGVSNSLFYISLQSIYQNAGFSVTASRIAGNTNAKVYQVTNSGSSLRLEVYCGPSSGYDDGPEFTVLELSRGQADSSAYSFSVIGYSQRGGGTQLL